MYLASAETAAATAIRGVITDPRDLGIPAPETAIPAHIPQEDPNLIPPASEAEAAGNVVHRGESIRPAPVKTPLEETLEGPVLIKVGDDISTDHIMPKSFSRIHHANLINWGLIPMVFTDPADYDRVGQEDVLEVPGVRKVLEGSDAGFTVRNRTKGTQFLVTADLNPRERIYILAGGKLSHVKAHPVR